MAQAKIDFKKLETLVKLKSNDELKLMIEKFDRTQLIDPCGSTLVHFAAKHNNVDLLKHLIAKGFDLNIKNVGGSTPFLTAASFGNSEALNVLLDANASIFVPTGRGNSILKVILDKKRGISTNIIADVLKHLRKRCVDVDETVTHLTKVNCPLDLVILMEDAEVMAMMLCRVEIMGPKECYKLLERAIKWGYIDNVRVILDHGKGDYISMMGYVNNLCSVVDSTNSDIKTAKILIEHMTNWKLYEHFWLIAALCRVFEEKSKEVVQFFIDCGVPEQVKKKYDFDLLAHVFENDNFEASEVFENREFDANALNMHRSTGLCVAAAKGLVKNIEFLLDRGADPNLADKYGMAPMHYAQLAECVILLLRYGADLQIIGKQCQTIFDEYDENKTPVQLAHLAMIETQGVVVKDEIREKINADSEMKHLFEKCAWELEQMKNITIYKKVTFHTVLFAKIDEFFYCIRSREAVNMILNRSQELGIHDYYTLILDEKLSEAARMYDLRCKAARFIADCTKIYYPGHLVVDMILGYLNVKDLEMFDCDEEDFVNSF